ncbi:hypothetical protein [Streptomyces nigrescens]
MTSEPPHGQVGRHHRSVGIELDGLLQHVPAEYHPTGVLVGHMVTARAFHAESRIGECPVPVAMPLHRPTARTDPRLIVVDDLAERWVMGFNVQYNQLRYRITGFYPAGWPGATLNGPLPWGWASPQAVPNEWTH